MVNLQWQILSVEETDSVITSAHYRVTARGYEQVVQSEGHWKFPDPVAILPYEKVRQTDIISWIEQGSKGAISSNLESQLLALNKEKPVLPWLKTAFTPFKD